MLTYSSKQVRDDFSTVLSRVAYAGERVIITRQGKGLVALVPIGDLQVIEKFQDYTHVERDFQSSARAKRKDTNSHKSAKKKLSLKSKKKSGPIWEQLGAMVDELPFKLFDRLPQDGASNHDKYLYGTGK